MKLSQRWQQLDHVLGGNPTQVETFHALLAAYREPQRAYHTLPHLQHCFAELDQVKHLAHNPHEIEFALWFHDAIYDPRRSDNEALSAAWATRYLQAGNAPTATIAQACALILATRHDTFSEESTMEGDLALLMDIDLTILGAPPDQFDAYDAAIRQEYDWVSERLYRKRRTEVLTNFLQRPVIYQIDFFYHRYEQQARENLIRCIQRLGD